MGLGASEPLKVVELCSKPEIKIETLCGGAARTLDDVLFWLGLHQSHILLLSTNPQSPLNRINPQSLIHNTGLDDHL